MSLNVGLFKRVCPQHLTTGNQLFVPKLCYFLCAVSMCSKKSLFISFFIIIYYLTF